MSDQQTDQLPPTARAFTQITLRVDPDVYLLARGQAMEDGVSLNEWIGRAVTERLERLVRQAAQGARRAQ